MFPLFGGQSQYEPLHFQTAEQMLMAPMIPGTCVWGVPEPTGVWVGGTVRASAGNPRPGFKS